MCLKQGELRVMQARHINDDPTRNRRVQPRNTSYNMSIQVLSPRTDSMSTSMQGGFLVRLNRSKEPGINYVLSTIASETVHGSVFPPYSGRAWPVNCLQCHSIDLTWGLQLRHSVRTWLVRTSLPMLGCCTYVVLAKEGVIKFLHMFDAFKI